jgi:hypothetical protein
MDARIKSAHDVGVHGNAGGEMTDLSMMLQ